VMQEIYSQPCSEDLIGQRTLRIKAKEELPRQVPPRGRPCLRQGGGEAGGGPAVRFAGRGVPPSTSVLKAAEASNLTSPLARPGLAVVIGNCVTYAGGPGADCAPERRVWVGWPGGACTSRGVLGVGIPQATAVADCAPLATTSSRKGGRGCR